MTTSGTFYHEDYGAKQLSHVPLCRIGHAFLNFKFTFLRNPLKTYLNDMCFSKLASTPRKDGKPLQGMTLQEKEV